LSEQGYGQGQPDEAGRAAYGPPGQPQYGAGPGQGAGYPAGYPAQGGAAYPPPAQPAGDTKGFLGSLFDFGFTSFVTPKVVKVLYPLIMILAALGALAFVGFAFTASIGFGIVSLVVLAPLWFLVVIAIYRISLELFIVIFRIAEDLRAVRQQGGIR
jgi:hypothetical protein